MKKILLLIMTVVLTSSCAELFCDMFNNPKEKDKDRLGAGYDIYAVKKSDINCYVTCKSGWSTVYWCAPHTWRDQVDFDYRPRFLAQEATVTPYPDRDNPMVYICEYPEITETYVEDKGNNYRAIHGSLPQLGLKPHCASWEVISSDKRVLPVLMAGEGGFPYAKPNVMKMLDGYVESMKSLKAYNGVLDSAVIVSWDDNNKIAVRIYSDRKTSVPSIGYDTGYIIAGNWDDPDFWLPQWLTRADDPRLASGKWHKSVSQACFWLYYNSFAHDSFAVPYPLKNAATELFKEFPVGGYKYGDHVHMYIWLSLENGVSIPNDNDNYIYNPNQVELEMIATSSARTRITMYCILPEVSGCSKPIWCVNPEDWFSK